MVTTAALSSDLDGSGPSRVELRTLGRVELCGPGGIGALHEIVRQPKRLALLAYLTLAVPRGSHSRDHLVLQLWPEMAPGRSRAALRRALYFLRRRLGDEVLRGKGTDRIGIDENVLWCDAVALDRMRAEGRNDEALELYRGELLPGLGVDGAPEFERWLDGRRHELRRSATAAALAIAARARATNDPAAEADLLERALEISPEREPILRDLLRARARAGDRARGLDAYRRWLRHREREASPSARTRALAEAVSSGEVVSASEPETGPASSGAEARAPIRGGQAPAILSPRRLAARGLAARARQLAEGGPAKNLAARELADEALRLDSGSGAAYAARAEARAQGVQLFGAHRGLLAAALDDAHRALELSAHLPEAHFSHGLVLETGGHLKMAVRPFRRATELSGDVPEFSSHLGRVLTLRGGFAHSLDWTHRQVKRQEPTVDLLLQIGFDHWCLGRPDEATELYRRARELGGPMVWLDASWSYFELVRGHFDRAGELADRMLAEQPDDFTGHFAAGDAALFARDFTKAAEHYEHCYRLDPESRHGGTQRSSRLALGFARLRAGDRGTGRALVEAAERETRRLVDTGADYGGLWIDLAAARAALGRTEEAIATLARATDEGWRQASFLRLDPMFEDLRGDERFEETITFYEEDIRAQHQALSPAVFRDCEGLVI